MLAPPHPRWQQRRFLAATLNAIALNGSRPVMNCARIGGEGAGTVCTFSVLLSTMNNARPYLTCAPLPLAAAEAFCNGSYLSSLFIKICSDTTITPRGRGKKYCPGWCLSKKEGKNRILLLILRLVLERCNHGNRKGGGDGDCCVKYAATQQSTHEDRAIQTICCPGQPFGKEKDKRAKSAFFSSSFDSTFDNTRTETGRGVEAATVMGQTATVRTKSKTKMPASLRR